MSYLVLARKWRPKTFNEVVGQQHVLRALINGLDQDRLHQAFLFAGTRGVGKTTLARILAKSLNCEQGVSSTPCGECQSCQEVDAGRFVDLIEVDAASRTKVDDTRELLDNVQYAPSRGRYKVYLIDEVHMLSSSSFNALLKTLEEPPPHVKFLFATTDPQKLPVTILSRCLQFNLRRIELKQISDHLADILQKEDIPFEHDALLAIARAADGSMRDALSLLDQAIAFGSGHVSVEHVHHMLGTIEQHQLFHIVTALINHDATALLAQSQELSAQGRDFTLILNELLALLQRLATLQHVPNLALSDADNSEQLHLLSTQLEPETIQLFYQIALHGKRDLPYAADPQSGFDMTLLRMLSFQPKLIADSTSNEPSSTPAQAVMAAKPVVIAEEVTATISPNVHLEKTDYHVQEPAPEVVITSSTENEAPVTLTASTWTTTISGLKLTALTRQLADNCAFIHYNNNKISLFLTPELAHLATEKAKERLEAALKKHLNISITITLSFEHDNATHQSTQTLATEQAVQRDTRQQHAVDSIHNDPTVHALKDAFNGRIIESTIKPIN